MTLVHPSSTSIKVSITAPIIRLIDDKRAIIALLLCFPVEPCLLNGSNVEARRLFPHGLARSLTGDGLRHVERRVAREKSRRNQLEAGAVTSHHRPLFGARDMRHAERVPDHQVAVFNRAIRRRPFW